MQKISLLFLVMVSLFAEDFISEFEYGQMLYRNPRGVSCVPCHGETGEGREIVSYTDSKGQTVTISGPDIRFATLAQIRNSVQESRGIMPRYFLTDKEIRTIHAYLQKLNTPEAEEAESDQEATASMVQHGDALSNTTDKSTSMKPQKRKSNPWEGIQ